MANTDAKSALVVAGLPENTPESVAVVCRSRLLNAATALSTASHQHDGSCHGAQRPQHKGCLVVEGLEVCKRLAHQRFAF